MVFQGPHTPSVRRPYNKGTVVRPTGAVPDPGSMGSKLVNGHIAESLELYLSNGLETGNCHAYCSPHYPGLCKWRIDHAVTSELTKKTFCDPEYPTCRVRDSGGCNR